MKSRETLLSRWAETIARNGQKEAIFDQVGASLRTFREIEEQARGFEAEERELGEKLALHGVPPGRGFAARTAP